MRTALVLFVALSGCLAPVPDHEVLPPIDAGVHDAGVWVCGPGTCAGCCDHGRCRAGANESACGNHGMACAVCGDDALCGPSNSCEPLDPMRYAPGTPNPGQPQNNGRHCSFVNGTQVCW